MAKVPDDERILEILRRGGQATGDDWAWVRRYLELADKCLDPGDKTPPEDTAKKPSPARSDAQQAAEPANAADTENIEAAKAESKPQARKQSA